ncbi:PAS domain S-box protein [Halobacteria archaeon AArc-m2/3/4]|uniref:histidine kinase n=1 Tax=Natronoglomus mannanivorans TaxID=2979990 RepID=A0ABT2QCZ9_9EURY|nr:PAS domain S-box protein [Halobacteria archaeon AArc-m2/3/4]
MERSEPPNGTSEDVRALFSALDQPSAPLTTAEIAEELAWARPVTRQRLEELSADGTLQFRQLPDDTRVWWQSDTSEQTSEHADRTAFSAFVNAVEDYAIFVLEPTGIVASWNDGAERIKGYAKDEIVGEHVSTFYTDADVDAGVPEANLETAVIEGRVEDEGWRVRADGTRFWANVTITAIRDDDGRLQGFTKVTRDMTERREYEQRLHQERDLTEQILETVPVGIGLLTPDGSVVRSNRRLIEWLGLESWRRERDRDEDGNRNGNEDEDCHWTLHDADGEPVPTDELPWSRVAETGVAVHDFECRADRPGAETGPRWLSIDATPIADGHRDDDRIVVSVDDVTDRKERERQLRREYDQTEKLLQTAPIAISVTDDSGEIVMANRRAQETLDLSNEELVTQLQTADDWQVRDVNGDPIDPTETPSARVLASGEPVFDEEISIEQPDGDRIELRVNAAPIFGPGGEIDRVITTGEEITALKRRERQLERRKAELETELSEILDRISDAFYALDDEWRFTHLNESAADILQYSEDELLGREVWDVFPDAKAGVYREQFRTAMERQEPVSFEVYADAVEAWLEFNVYPSESGLSIYFHDVTERVEREHALERAQRRFEAIFEDPNILVGLLEPDGTVVDINGTAMEYIDADLEAVTGDPFWETPWWGEGDEVGADVESWVERAATGEYIDFEADLTRPEGDQYTLSGSFRPVTDADGEVVSIIVSDRDVTERREYERALEERERQLSTLMENVPGMVYRCRNERGWPMEFVSDACREITGYEPEALESGAVNYGEDIMLEADREDVWAEIQQTVDEEDLFSVTYRIETADGDRRWVRSYGRGIFDDEGTLVSLEGIVADITERKRLETELAASERRYRTFAEYFPNGAVALFDDELVYTLAAGQGFEAVPADPERLEGRHLRAVWDDEIADQLEPTYRGALAGEERSVEISYGGREWVSYAVPVTDDQGTVVAGMTMVQDITERKERERELAKYETIVETIDDGIYVKDDDGLFTMVNDAYAELTGYDREQLVGAHASLVVDEDTIQQSSAMQAVMADENDADSTMEAMIQTADGELVPTEGTIATIETEGGDGEDNHVGVVRDITERKERQRKLEQSNERLEQFAYAASHDLQEPLRMVSSYLQLIDRRYGDELDAEGEEFLAFAVDGADRMRNMIEGLLEYSRVDTRGDPFEPVDLNRVLADVREDLQVKIEEHDADVTVGSLPRVEGDSEQLRQLFQNLVDNAIEYSGEEPPRVHVDAERDGDWWELSVRDEGIGIDPADADSVFEVFQRLHTPDEHEGTGIGLALCKRIVERHGGEIWVDSEPGEGSTFAVRLLAADDRDRNR